MTIRALTLSDLPQAKSIIDDNQMFPSEFLDEMTTGFLESASDELWYVAESTEGEVNAVAFCAPERMTEGTWNLLLIDVSKRCQGKGIGSELIAFIEHILVKKDARVLLVETPGLPDYQLTREFYPKCGYKQVAVIPEYYEAGDDKVVFWKSLTQ